MTAIDDIQTLDFDSIPIDLLWNLAEERELKIHQIHAYPAKFPAFVTTNAIKYAEENNVTIHTIADIFCGCGTTAFESKRNGINFWGCDINPVATLIAKTKSKKYQFKRLFDYYNTIISLFQDMSAIEDQFENANERLKYWYAKNQYNALACLKKLILEETPLDSDYQGFFLCAFSNILKPASVWLTKSIKPQVDPNKNPMEVLDLFCMQCEKMFAAYQEIPTMNKSENMIITGNFLDDSLKFPKTDMIVTSPPYVTSYEYADLHQLSTLWLGFTEDYKDLRYGTIGSKFHDYNYEEDKKNLNATGMEIVTALEGKEKRKARSVAKYFFDMQKVTKKTFSILNKNGLILFVIGNTEYKGVKINNVKHLAESMVNAGYKGISVTKRKISKKILTPYRDKNGRFTANSHGRKVYSEEFILIGKK